MLNGTGACWSEKDHSLAHVSHCSWPCRLLMVSSELGAWAEPSQAGPVEAEENCKERLRHAVV